MQCSPIADNVPDSGLAPPGEQRRKSCTHRPGYILPVIVLTQFAGTAIWFSGNAVLGELSRLGAASPNMVAWITNAVQFGFIVGTLVFATFAISDRFAARWVFFACAVAGATANLATTVAGADPMSILGLRFACGFFLAGIYPVGMKIAAGWYARGLGNAMGFLIGALVVGTAFPHLIKGGLATVPWQAVMAVSSGVCLTGGLLMALLVPDGPYSVRAPRFNPSAVATIFSHRPLRAAACGYFGHMWELYTLWAFAPLFIQAYAETNPDAPLNIPLWSFLVIGSGSIGCIGGGMLSRRLGSAWIARMELGASLVCCLVSPLFFAAAPSLFLTFMILWGATAAGDSPQFSTMVARAAPTDRVGSALTLVNCIGFSITMVSLSLLQWLTGRIPVPLLLVVLAIGPAAGLFCMRTLDDRT